MCRHLAIQRFSHVRVSLLRRSRPHKGGADAGGAAGAGGAADAGGADAGTPTDSPNDVFSNEMERLLLPHRGETSDFAFAKGTVDAQWQTSTNCWRSGSPFRSLLPPQIPFSGSVVDALKVEERTLPEPTQIYVIFAGVGGGRYSAGVDLVVALDFHPPIPVAEFV